MTSEGYSDFVFEGRVKQGGEVIDGGLWNHQVANLAVTFEKTP